MFQAGFQYDLTSLLVYETCGLGLTKMVFVTSQVKSVLMLLV